LVGSEEGNNRIEKEELYLPRAIEVEERNLMMRFFTRFAKDQSGVTAIEYGLIAGLIAVVIISAVTTLGTKISAKFNAIAANLS
jgi:pilus assembly protein Flp/PilA